MSKTHPAYPPEYRLKVVELIRSGRSLHDVAHEFKLSTQSIRNWLKQHALDSGHRADGLTTAERDELGRLRRKVKQLEIEREILSKAAVDSTGQRNASFSLLAGVSYCKIFRGR